MRNGIALAVLLFTGCSGGAKPDPATDRLPVGRNALVVADREAETELGVFLHVGNPRDAKGKAEMLPLGTRVQCEWDASKALSEAEEQGRLTRVLVLDGEHKGKIGYISRRNLRPVAR